MGIDDFGIDLGTVNTLIYKKNKGILINEPSVIAIDSLTNKTIAVGKEAKMMLGRVPNTVSVTYTMQDGVISSFEKTATMLRAFIKRIKTGFGGMRIVISIPCRATAVERRAVEDVAYAAHAKRVYLIEEPLAAALGTGIPIFEPRGRMVVDMGGGTTEIAVISLGGVVSFNSINCSGNQMNHDVINHIRKTYNVLIGEPTAENLKINLGSVIDYGTMDFMTVSGRDLTEGLPINVAVSSDDVREAMSKTIQGIIDGIKYTLEHIDPELSADIIENGITLTGGCALFKGWTDLIYNTIGVQSEISSTPLECVAVGAGNALDILDKLKQFNSLS
ncbi:MAG: cell shape determining protein MreB/Mrl family [Clostridia bacterium]|jgi:rod shape-determining protein MreB|nr:cell shape determining protein MreB/Mrl family [Clostridia bacterium]